MPVAAVSITVTACILLILRWNRPAQLQADSKIAGFVKGLIGRKPRKSAVEEKRREEDEAKAEAKRVGFGQGLFSAKTLRIF